MSTPARLVRASGLTLGRVAVTIAGQIASVPIYISYWDAKTYGVWLILQGMFGYLSLMSTAHQQYSYGEVLRRGPKDHAAVHVLYRTSLVIAALIALAEFGAVLAFAPMAAAAVLPEDATGTTSIVALILILHSALNLATMPFGAITAQTMTIHGHYPALAAWGLMRTASALFAPALAVVLGADLLTAGVVLIASHAVPAALSLAYFARLASRQGLLAPVPIDWCMGLRNALFCLPLAGRDFIDSFRQQGFRIILSPYAGPVAVTALATTRTFANLLHQGLGTITAPLLPELMRYVVNRDQDRMEGAFAIVWLSVFSLLVPSVLMLSLLAEPIFLFWTRGAVAFDPVLFLTLMMAVLVYALGQPTAAILQGQNRIAWMISASVTAAFALGTLSVLLVPPFGLRGAGFALLGAELCAVSLTVAGAASVLRQSGLAFPWRSFALVAATVGSVFGLSLLAVTAFGGRPGFMALPFSANVLLAALYWATIPTLARDRIWRFLAVLGSPIRARLQWK